jgi:uncharacterized protein YecT (DUF1311 family)
MRYFTLFLLLLPSLAAAAAATPLDHQQVYSDCLAKAGGINNGSVEACSSTASDGAKAEMTRLYRALYSRLLAENADDAAKLERAQKSWLVYRDLHCELAGSYVGSPMYAFCPMQLNIGRVIELREMVGQ